MLKLKVCGMRDKENIKALSELKPDFMGFIFHEKSPRNVTHTISITIPKDISKVGVFVNKPIEFITEKIKAFNLDYIQLHGNESPEFCSELKNKGLKIIKAFNISEAFDFTTLKSYESFCDYFLFDAFGKQAGGNGIAFDWALLNNYKGELPFLLSGGINDTMVSSIKNITHLKFSGIDINSGFETAPALKNIKSIKSFSETIRKSN
ncbi:MAG: phosphoribosylanthranilate isomerase [Flavobacteriaceae bacterium]